MEVKVHKRMLMRKWKDETDVRMRDEEDEDEEDEKRDGKEEEDEVVRQMRDEDRPQSVLWIDGYYLLSRATRLF